MAIQTSKVSCDIEKNIIYRLIHTFFRPDSSCHVMTKKRRQEKSDQAQRRKGLRLAVYDVRVHLKLCCVALI